MHPRESKSKQAEASETAQQESWFSKAQTMFENERTELLKLEKEKLLAMAKNATKKELREQNPCHEFVINTELQDLELKLKNVRSEVDPLHADTLRAVQELLIELQREFDFKSSPFHVRPKHDDKVQTHVDTLGIAVKDLERELNKTMELGKQLQGTSEDLQNSIDQQQEQNQQLRGTSDGLQNSLNQQQEQNQRQQKALRAASENMNGGFLAFKLGSVHLERATEDLQHQLNEQIHQQEQVKEVLKDHRSTLNNHIQVINTHREKLGEHDGKLSEHRDTMASSLQEHGEHLTSHSAALASSLQEHGSRLQKDHECLATALGTHQGKLSEHCDTMTQSAEALKEGSEQYLAVIQQDLEKTRGLTEQVIEVAGHLQTSSTEMVEASRGITEASEIVKDAAERSAEMRAALNAHNVALGEHMERIGSYSDKLDHHDDKLEMHGETVTESVKVLQEGTEQHLADLRAATEGLEQRLQQRQDAELETTAEMKELATGLTEVRGLTRNVVGMAGDLQAAATRVHEASNSITEASQS
eukprot:1549254-Rhodomonas_salina.1